VIFPQGKAFRRKRGSARRSKSEGGCQIGADRHCRRKGGTRRSLAFGAEVPKPTAQLRAGAARRERAARAEVNRRTRLRERARGLELPGGSDC
jgi:hypothetical protein